MSFKQFLQGEKDITGKIFPIPPLSSSLNLFKYFCNLIFDSSIFIYIPAKIAVRNLRQLAAKSEFSSIMKDENLIVG